MSKQKPLKRLIETAGPIKRILQLSRLRRKYERVEPNSVVRFLDYRLRVTDGLNFYVQCKDEFIQRIYHFKSIRPDPLIIDGGSNIGMSILYFKRLYPQARIIGFEPDQNVFRILQENLKSNHITDVTLVEAGLGAEVGTVGFAADDKAGGQFDLTQNSQTVRVERLSDHINEQVDFLKLNIEGQELPVLKELTAAGKLRNIREMVIEYHGWAGGDQLLGDLLVLLNQSGYRYLVHDFDHETGDATKPPFQINPDVPWFCLVYGRRVDEA